MRSHVAATSIVSTTMPVLEERLEARDRVPVVQPALDRLRADEPSAAAGRDGLDGGALGRDHRLGTLAEHEQQALARAGGAGERAAGLDLVVEPQHRGPPAVAHDAPEALEPGVKLGNAIAW